MIFPPFLHRQRGSFPKDGFDRITKDTYTPLSKPGTGEVKARKDGAAVTSTYGYLGTDRGQADGSKTKGDKTTDSLTTRLISDLTVTVGSGKAAKTAVSESLSYDKLGRIDGHVINTSDYADLNGIAGAIASPLVKATGLSIGMDSYSVDAFLDPFASNSIAGVIGSEYNGGIF